MRAALLRKRTLLQKLSEDIKRSTADHLHDVEMTARISSEIADLQDLERR